MSIKNFDLWLLENLDFSGLGYELEPKDKKEALLMLGAEFERVAWFDWNIKKFKNNKVLAFADFLQGLPSYVWIPYMNNEIKTVLFEFGFIKQKTREKTQEKLISDYWKLCASRYLMMIERAKRGDKILKGGGL